MGESIKGLDTAESTVNRAHELLGLGYRAVGLYIRPDRTSQAEIDGLHSVGIRIWSIWEKGEPNKAGYFTADRGTADATEACQNASNLGQPPYDPSSPGSGQIFFAYDGDLNPDDLTDYANAVHATCRANGYLASAYGSGNVVRALVNSGVAHSGWQALSTGWSGYRDEPDPAYSIMQFKGVGAAGLNSDEDSVLDSSVLW